MSRIFFISIRPNPDEFSYVSTDDAYKKLGLNTGNLLFTNAVWRQLKYEEAESGFGFDPQYVNENFDKVVIPAANWLYESFDFSDLAALIERLTIPVVMIGVGAQAGVDKEIPVLPKGSVRLIHAISERSNLIGTRGDFSTEVLEHYGIKNAVTIGCPSLFFHLNGVLNISKNGVDKIMVGGTRYFFPSHNEKCLDVAQRSIYRLAYKEKFDINYQSERPEFDFISSKADADIGENSLKATYEYYGCDSEQELLKYFSNHGRVFLNVNDWIAAMAEYDFYIGSRIHGVIATLLSGTPACLLTHDSRTREVADFASIPSSSLDEIGKLTTSDVETLYDKADFVLFQNTIHIACKNYIRFLETNQLSHNFVC